MRIEKATKGAAGTEQEVLESLDRISLGGPHRGSPPPLRGRPGGSARLVEPAVRHVKLASFTPCSPEDVEGWVEATEREPLDRIGHGPVVVS